MDEQQVTVRNVAWRDLCPAFLIFRSLPVALSVSVLILALLGVVLTPIGWFIMDRLVVTDYMLEDQAFANVTEMNRLPYKAVFPEWHAQESLFTVLGNQVRGIELVFYSYARSIYGLFSLQPGLARFFYFLIGGFWTLFIWSFFGCAITRVALMRYTRDEPIGIDDALEYAFEKFLSCLAGVLIPFVIGVVALTIPLSILGLLMLTDIGVAVAGLFWFVVLAIALLIVVSVFFLAFGWPLIVSAISCEGQDSFDGISRAFGYLLQRPFHYFAYAAIGILFSGLCWLLVSNVIEWTIHTSYWATSWGSNVLDDRAGELRRESPGAPGAGTENLGSGNKQATSKTSSTDSGGSEDASFMFWLGQQMMWFWEGVARTLGTAFLYGLFWCIVAAMYLLLRKDLDDTEMDEIYLAEEARTFDLPPLKDDDGVPQIDSQSSETDSSNAGQNTDET